MTNAPTAFAEPIDLESTVFSALILHFSSPASFCDHVNQHVEAARPPDSATIAVSNQYDELISGTIASVNSVAEARAATTVKLCYTGTCALEKRPLSDGVHAFVGAGLQLLQTPHK